MFVVLAKYDFLHKVWYIMDRYQTRQMEQKDTRVNLVNEILNGIKVQIQFENAKEKEEDKSQGCSQQGSEDVRLGAAVHGNDWRHQARF